MYCQAQKHVALLIPLFYASSWRVAYLSAWAFLPLYFFGGNGLERNVYTGTFLSNITPLALLTFLVEK
jgi:hypothetical protein